MRILDRLLGRPRLSSREIAKERLQLVLTYDRTELSPSLLEALKGELIDATSKYVDIDKGEVKVTLAREGRRSRVVADIPLLSSQAGSSG